MTPFFKSICLLSYLLPLLMTCFPTSQSHPVSRTEAPRSASPIALNPLDPPPSSANLTTRRYTCEELPDYPGYTTFLADFLPKPRYLPLRTVGFGDIAFQHLVWAMGDTVDPAKSPRRFSPIAGGSFVYEHLSYDMRVRLRQAPGAGQPVITYAAAFHAILCLREYADSTLKAEFYAHPFSLVTESTAGGQAISGTFGRPEDSQLYETS